MYFWEENGDYAVSTAGTFRRDDACLFSSCFHQHPNPKNDNFLVQAFFRNPVNADAVQNSFKIMEQAMLRYDVDKSRTLQLTELNQIFRDHFKEMFDAGTVTSITNAVHPNLSQDVRPLLSRL